MANLQVTIGGAAVAIGQGTASNLPFVNQVLSLYQGDTLITRADNGGDGAPNTIGNLTVTGDIYPDSVQAMSGAATGTGFYFVTEGPQGTKQSPLFDVVPAPPPPRGLVVSAVY